MNTTVNTNPSGVLLEGAKVLFDAVSSTLGPKGRYVIIEEPYKFPVVTKDGVTVAKAITLKHETKQIGVDVLRQAATNTVSRAGDGTTSAIVLAYNFLKLGHKLISSGISPVVFKKVFYELLEKATNELEKNSKKIETVDELMQIATISSNNDEALGELMAEAYSIAGLDGTIIVEEAKGGETKIEEIKGIQISNGYISEHFINDENNLTCELYDAYVLVFDGKLRNPQHIIPILDEVYAQGKSLIVIADEIGVQVAQLLIINKLKKGLQVAAVKAPRYGSHRKQLMEDLAILTGGELVTEEVGRTLKSTKVSNLGYAKKVIITEGTTTLFEGKADTEELEKRIAKVKKEIELTKDNLRINQYRSRLARLTKGMVVMYIGALVEGELREKLDRTEDSLKATRAALLGGTLPGGGKALLEVAKSLQKSVDKLKGDEKLAGEVFLKVLESPTRTIARNAGVSGDIVVNKTAKGNLCYNALTDKYVDPYKDGIIDPSLVILSALSNAVAISTVMLMTNCTIAFDTPTDYIPPLSGVEDPATLR